MDSKYIAHMSDDELMQFISSKGTMKSEWMRKHLFFFFFSCFEIYHPLEVTAGIKGRRQILGPIMITSAIIFGWTLSDLVKLLIVGADNQQISWYLITLFLLSIVTLLFSLISMKINKEEKKALKIYRDCLISLEKLLRGPYTPLVKLLATHWQEFQIEGLIEKELISRAEVFLAERGKREEVEQKNCFDGNLIRKEHQALELLTDGMSVARLFNFSIREINFYLQKAGEKLAKGSEGDDPSVSSSNLSGVCEGDC